MVEKTAAATARLIAKCVPPAFSRGRKPKGLRRAGRGAPVAKSSLAGESGRSAMASGDYKELGREGRRSRSKANGPPGGGPLAHTITRLGRDRAAHRREVLRQDGRAR